MYRAAADSGGQHLVPPAAHRFSSPLNGAAAVCVCVQDADDMVKAKPDDKSVMTYVAYYWKAFQRNVPPQPSSSTRREFCRRPCSKNTKTRRCDHRVPAGRACGAAGCVDGRAGAPAGQQAAGLRVLGRRAPAGTCRAPGRWRRDLPPSPFQCQHGEETAREHRAREQSERDPEGEA